MILARAVAPYACLGAFLHLVGTDHTGWATGCYILAVLLFFRLRKG